MDSICNKVIPRISRNKNNINRAIPDLENLRNNSEEVRK